MAAIMRTAQNHVKNARNNCRARMLRKRSEVTPARSRFTVMLRPNADRIVHSSAMRIGTAIAAITVLFPRSDRVIKIIPPILLGSRLLQAVVHESPMGKGPRSINPTANTSRQASRPKDQRQSISTRKITESCATERSPWVMGLGGLVIDAGNL